MNPNPHHHTTHPPPTQQLTHLHTPPQQHLSTTDPKHTMVLPLARLPAGFKHI